MISTSLNLTMDIREGEYIQYSFPTDTKAIFFGLVSRRTGPSGRNLHIQQLVISGNLPEDIFTNGVRILKKYNDNDHEDHVISIDSVDFKITVLNSAYFGDTLQAKLKQFPSGLLHVYVIEGDVPSFDRRKTEEELQLHVLASFSCPQDYDLSVMFFNWRVEVVDDFRKSVCNSTGRQTYASHWMQITDRVWNWIGYFLGEKLELQRQEVSSNIQIGRHGSLMMRLPLKTVIDVYHVHNRWDLNGLFGSQWSNVSIKGMNSALTSNLKHYQVDGIIKFQFNAHDMKLRILFNIVTVNSNLVMPDAPRALEPTMEIAEPVSSLFFADDSLLETVQPLSLPVSLPIKRKDRFNIDFREISRHKINYKRCARPKFGSEYASLFDAAKSFISHPEDNLVESITEAKYILRTLILKSHGNLQTHPSILIAELKSTHSSLAKTMDKMFRNIVF